MAVEVHVYVDVADLERGIAFYSRGLGLGLGRRLDATWVEMTGAPAPIHILEKPATSPACSGGGPVRDYARHWTPIHLDFVVPALDAAVARACAAGATLDREIQERAWEGQRTRLANLADPFGNGFCLIEEPGGRRVGELEVYVDVADLARGIDFYTRGVGLALRQLRWPDLWAELEGGSVPVHLLAMLPGTPARVGEAGPVRDYARHWTPVHLDFLTRNLDAAVAQAGRAGATLERAGQTYVWGRMANLADPFGNGFDLIELRGRGYGELAPLA